LVKNDQLKHLINVLNQAFYSLGLNVGQETLESLASTIHQAMSGKGRYYHTPEHALALSDANNPVQSLAALFHDLVYYPVDQDFSPEIWITIKPYVCQNVPGEAGLRLVDAAPADDSSFHIVKHIFGFSNGYKLNSSVGSNEFLSSLVMVKKLKKILPIKVLIQIVTYIEATIPFRTVDGNGTGPFEKLAQRLRSAAQSMNIPLSEGEIDETIQGAVVFANKDVGNFTNPDTATFLESTWMLLPELNPALRSGSVNSLRDYRQALQAMEKFLRSIKTETVLHEYKGVPTWADSQRKLVNIHKNLTIGCEYLELKILAMAILEALAEISGGDAPVSLFVGEVDKNSMEEPGLRRYYPAVEPFAPGVDPNSAIYKLLEAGVRGPVDLADVKTSPMALYVYQRSGPQIAHDYLDSAQEMFTGKIKPIDFLQVLDESLVAVIVNTIAELAVTRREKLVSFISQKVQ
jgi:hypothetical protein